MSSPESVDTFIAQMREARVASISGYVRHSERAPAHAAGIDRDVTVAYGWNVREHMVDADTGTRTEGIFLAEDGQAYQHSDRMTPDYRVCLSQTALLASFDPAYFETGAGQAVLAEAHQRLTGITLPEVMPSGDAQRSIRN